MKLKKNKYIPLLALFISITGNTIGQSNYELNFQGMLFDIQGKSINTAQFDLTVQLKNDLGHEVLYEFCSSTSTDEQGWFGFTLSEINHFLMDGGELSKPVVIHMEFQPNKHTKWLRQGEDFMVTYTLSPIPVNSTIQMKMTRIEGSDLVTHSEDHLYAFKDQYPFSYLLGGFLLTDQLPVSDQAMDDLKQWVSPDLQDVDGGASRGVKGGFPAGGVKGGFPDGGTKK